MELENIGDLMDNFDILENKDSADFITEPMDNEPTETEMISTNVNEYGDEIELTPGDGEDVYFQN
jgi:hypothetical protein